MSPMDLALRYLVVAVGLLTLVCVVAGLVGAFIDMRRGARGRD